MNKTRYLIVNADDFGQSAGINRGIVAAHQQGIVTSASLMVRWPHAREAAEYARARGDVSIGLHVDLGEWFFDRGEWKAMYKVVDLKCESAVADELAKQIESFRALLGQDPTHIDSHQHVHLQEPVKSILLAAAIKLGVPLRNCESEISYCGGFYGQTAEGDSLPNVITVTNLKSILAELSDGISELGCHPGFADDIKTMYRGQRADEVAVLCDQRIKAAIAELGIELISFAELPVLV
jgi:predicted glycoside hydrolase/deacetylase ChbG (UPF0249 family)